MRKILMSAIIAYLLLLTVLLLNGRIGLVQGVEDIKAENERLDGKIEEVSKLTSIAYPQSYSDLKLAQKTMEDIKQDYETRVTYSGASNVQNENKKENYNIEYLWTKIGKYATKDGLKLKMEVQNGNTESLKDLVFAATGDYTKISDFIYNLEEDEELDFRIENFRLTSDNGEGTTLTATFKVTDIALNMDNITTIETEENIERDS